MSSLTAKCPSCAATVEFQKGSTIVLVCPFCRSAIARTDRGLEDLGKVAEITESLSSLRVGLSGVWRGQHFELTGRIRKLHELGGFWDEWYAVFSNGWIGWLAEAQGKFYLTFYQALSPENRLPGFEQLQLGQTVPQIPSKTPLMVAEKGTATAVTAEGEIPFKFIPGATFDYADLSGEGDVFGTIDYGKPEPQVLIGQQLDLDEVGLSNARPKAAEAQSVEAKAISCPHCAAPLELVAPDRSQRVTCQFCNSLLDVNQGNLTFLNALKTEQKFSLDLVVGSEGAFENFAGGAKFKLIGAMTRSVTFDIKYFWNEYLLYNPLIGFRWLVQSDGHWNYVEPVNVADVKESAVSDLLVTFNEQDFRIYQDTTATVEYVTGEFYWRVTQGETVRAIDYVAPPRMLSKETADKEINWSLGTYLKQEEVEKAFNAGALPGSNLIAPNQPFRYNALIRAALIVLLAAIAVFAVAGFLFKPSSSPPPASFDQIFLLPAKTSADAQTVVYSSPILIDKKRDISLTVSAELDYESWADFDVSLVPANPELNKNDPEQVKSDSETSRNWSYQYVGSGTFKQLMATGEYQIRAEGKWKNWDKPLAIKYGLTQYDRSGLSLEFGLIFLFIIPPILFLLYKAYFEGSRWANGNMPRPGFLERIFSGVFAGK
jgi:Zn finger protein HypA/HybF involved in hydrogenase expression